MMNPEVKEKWLRALRSGEYRQGKRKLRSENDEYCCLGVLCDILGEEWVRQEFTLCYGVVDEDDPSHVHTTLPSDKVWKAAGLWDESRQCGNQMVGGGQHLSGMNDNGSTFEEIAEVVERYL